jgi:hypothetical protein
MRAVLVALLVVGLGGLGACGGSPPIPKRGVVESDLGSWKFRRFQGPLLDVEVWIEGNKGIAHSASYITAESEKRGQITDKDLVNVTVTKYEKDDGIIRETVRFARRLASEKGYQVEEDKVEGVRLLQIKGPGEAWVMWPARGYVVKIGGQGRTNVPEGLIEDYGDRFASRLPGGSLEGPLPPGPAELPKKGDEKEPYDPKNPHPDLDHYDPNKVKIPEKKVDTSADDDDDTDDKAEKSDDKDDKKKKKK